MICAWYNSITDDLVPAFSNFAVKSPSEPFGRVGGYVNTGTEEKSAVSKVGVTNLSPLPWLVIYDITKMKIERIDILDLFYRFLNSYVILDIITKVILYVNDIIFSTYIKIKR